MKARKRPERTCIVCRNKFDKRELRRIVQNKDGELFFDPTGKANGRGAYLCSDSKCTESFFNKNFLNRAFKRNVSQEEIDKVKEALNNNIEISADSEEKL